MNELEQEDKQVKKNNHIIIFLKFFIFFIFGQIAPKKKEELENEVTRGKHTRN